MKKRKAGDKLGWKAEWLIEGGDEMIKSLEILYNRIEQEKIIPKQWLQLIIKSVDKKGSGEELSKNQRGLFLVNIVPKVYEKVKKTQNETKHNKMSEMQTADKKQRSTMDNIVIVSAIIDQRRIEKSKTYMFFADTVKCFDQLWLQDCMIELAKLGYNKNDLEILYKLNETAQFKINTPYGDTENIETKEVVKQGTTYGPIMCCASIARVIEIGEKVICKYGNIKIGIPVFMDDIAAIRDADTKGKALRNCRKMETEKKNTIQAKKDKIFDKNWKRETGTNRRRSKGRKD